MQKINIITPPDKIFNDVYKILLIFPSDLVLNEIQKTVLSKSSNVNVYVFDKQVYNKENINWLLDAFQGSNFVLVDIDNSPVYAKELFSFLIAKPKTYWLTNAIDSVYNHISNNKLQDINILSKIGEQIEEF